jgi:hypothetical protein
MSKKHQRPIDDVSGAIPTSAMLEMDTRVPADEVEPLRSDRFLEALPYLAIGQLNPLAYEVIEDAASAAAHGVTPEQWIGHALAGQGADERFRQDLNAAVEQMKKLAFWPWV